MFHILLRTRQFLSVCRTTCFFGIPWNTLSQSTFHTLLFRVYLSTELRFGIGLCLLTHLFIYFPQKKGLMNWTLLPYVLRVPISRSIPSLCLVKNTNYDAAVCTPFFVLFWLCRIWQNYCPANFSLILSVWIFSVGLDSAIYSSRWSVTSDTSTLTYLLHGAESFMRSQQWTLPLVKKFSAFMVLESSSPYPQEPVIRPYPEPTPSSPQDPLQLPEDPS
jgi:hypothetical protein